MTKGKPSGIKLEADDIPIVLGMQARGDRDHDIAAWFGVNQGRIAEAKGQNVGVSPAPALQLPPKGPPGVKGRRLRADLDKILIALKSDGCPESVISRLQQSIDAYDAPEA